MSPFPDNPLIRLLYWLLNTPGVGAFFVIMLGATLVSGFGLILRWISLGAQASESIVYAYPTEGLHEHEVIQTTTAEQNTTRK